MSSFTQPAFYRARSSHGAIVAQIGENDFSLKPGQSWMQRRYADEAWYRKWYASLRDEAIEQLQSECSVVITERLTNFGLLESRQVSIAR